MIGKGGPAGKAGGSGQNGRSGRERRASPQGTLRTPRLLKRYSCARGGRASQFPSLGVLPRNVRGVIHVQQQAFPPVKKSEPDEVVVDEGRQRAQNDVGKAEAAVALGDGQLRS